MTCLACPYPAMALAISLGEYALVEKMEAWRETELKDSKRYSCQANQVVHILGHHPRGALNNAV